MSNSPHDRFGAVMARIAVAPNILRARREDEIRAERNVVDFDKQVEKHLKKIEKQFDALLKKVA